MSHDERFDDAVGPYLLHAMPEEEVAAFEAHLETCDACRQEVEHLRMAADALPSSPMQFEPPPELKDRIMAVVNAEAELLRAAGAHADAPPPPRRRRARLSVRPGLALAGALAVLVVGVVVGAALRGGGEDRVPFELAPPGARAALIERDSGHSTIELEGMPRPGAGRVYQVWLKRAGRAAPEPTSALFGVRPDGSASVDVPGRLDDVEAVLVTSEPAGGSPSPTRDPVLAVTPA